MVTAKFVRLPMTAGLAFILLAILLTACRSPEPQPVDTYERFRPALKSEYQHYFDELGPVPIYDIEVTYDAVENRLVGQASIEIPNYSAEPWNDLLFRLYPMLEQYGGNMVLQRIAVNGQPASFIYKRENTAIEVDLNETLQPGDTAVVDLAWRLEIPTWSDISSIYALFGSSQDMTALPLFYPSLSVYEEGDVLGDGQWWQALGSVRGDAAFQCHIALRSHGNIALGAGSGNQWHAGHIDAHRRWVGPSCLGNRSIA